MTTQEPTKNHGELAAPLLLTVKQTATLLQVGTNRVYEMVGRDELPSIRLNGIIRIPRSALLLWIEKKMAA